MIEPYRMVIVNLLVLIVLAAGLLIYRYVFPKKPLGYFIPLLLLSLLPTISLLRMGDYESGDFNMHVYRTISFVDSIREGYWRPLWTKDLNATYGYTAFLIGAPLIYYTNAFFYFIGFSFINSMKLLLGVTYVFSGITMYFWAKNELGRKAGFVAAVFYLFAPFHLVDMHFRVSPGGMLSYALFPLCFLSVKKIITSLSFPWFIVGSISLCLLVLSHPISLVGFFFILTYSFFHISKSKRKTSKLIIIFLLFFCGLGLSAFYWLPVLLENSNMMESLAPKGVSFSNIFEFLYSPYRYGLLFQGPNGELSFIIGYIHWLMIGVAVYYLVKNKYVKREKSLLIFFLSLFFLSFILMLPLSKPFWYMISILRNLQFSYRLMFFIVFFSSAIAGFAAQKIKNQLLIVSVVSLTVCLTILNWSHRRVIPQINDRTLTLQLPLSTYGYEGGSPAVTKWVDPKRPFMDKIPQNNIETITGEGKIIALKRLSEHHEYIIDAKSTITIKENTLYYPGWVVKVDNITQDINFQNKENPGVITFTLKKGIHKVDVLFTRTKLRQYADLISLLTLSILSLITCIFFGSKIMRRFFTKSTT